MLVNSLQIMMAFSLQRRLQNVGVTVSCLHPGVVSSRLNSVIHDIEVGLVANVCSQVNTELFRQHENKWYYFRPVVKPVVSGECQCRYQL